MRALRVWSSVSGDGYNELLDGASKSAMTLESVSEGLDERETKTSELERC